MKNKGDGGKIMSNRRVGTIRLSGADAVDFANALYNPSQEDIDNAKRLIDSINKNISITRFENGFEAEIADLDLSFLNETIEEKTLKLDVTLEVRIQLPVDLSEDTEISSRTIVKTGNDTESSSGDLFMSVAA